jgi:hypothetical protein
MAFGQATDLLFQQMSTVQDISQPLSPTIASAATIAPYTFMTFVTGTVQVATITPPVTGTHMLVLCFTNGAPGLFLTSGNIQIAYQPITNRPIMLIYDPASAKYWVNAVV